MRRGAGGSSVLLVGFLVALPGRAADVALRIDDGADLVAIEQIRRPAKAFFHELRLDAFPVGVVTRGGQRDGLAEHLNILLFHIELVGSSCFGPGMVFGSGEPIRGVRYLFLPRVQVCAGENVKIRRPRRSVRI